MRASSISYLLAVAASSPNGLLNCALPATDRSLVEIPR